MKFYTLVLVAILCVRCGSSESSIVKNNTEQSPQAASIAGEVVWVSPFVSGNGDSTLKVQTSSNPVVIYTVKIVGAPAIDPQTEVELLTGHQLREIVGSAVIVTGRLDNMTITATKIQERPKNPSL